jgi:hypothetical protein
MKSICNFILFDMVSEAQPDWSTEMDSFYYEGYEEALEKVLGARHAALCKKTIAHFGLPRHDDQPAEWD